MKCKRRGLLIATHAGFFAALILAGCKSSEDAAAAAGQMQATAQSLSDYYSGLRTTLENTNQLYLLNQQLDSKPYTDENRQLLKDNEEELEKRASLAVGFSSLAGDFAELSQLSYPGDVAASAVKLANQVDTLAKLKVSSNEQSALKGALQLLATVIQQHKEREAEKAMSGSVKALSDLFAKETGVWNSTEEVYSSIAATLAKNLVDANATDNSAMLKVALDPFGLTPSAGSADTNTKLAPLAKQQIATRQKQMDASFEQATQAMSDSLAEMGKRIDAVAAGKPMVFRFPPVSLATVEKWAAQAVAY